MSEGLHIPLDVLEEATSDIPLRVPGGAETGRILEPVLVMGSQVTKSDKLPGKTIIEVSFKVADTGTPDNLGKQFRQSFFITDASLSSRQAIAADMSTKINVRLLTELWKAIGGRVDANLLANFAGISPELLNGTAILMRAAVSFDKTGTKRFNVNAFAPAR